ncbi:unnamed protein product, partial [Polarella glacialis]
DCEGWRAVSSILAKQRLRLQGLLTGSEDFEAILFSERPKETTVLRRFQESVQIFGIRGLGCEHSWRLLSDLGVRRVSAEVAAAAAGIGNRAMSEKTSGEPGRGERANWCFFRCVVSVVGVDGTVLSAQEPGRIISSSVVNYREDYGGMVSVKLHHDRVDHRSWDAEFRAMGRVAAAARSLLLGNTQGPGCRAAAESAAAAFLRDGA